MRWNPAMELINLRSQLSVALEQVSTHLQKKMQAVNVSTTRAADKMRIVGNETQGYLRMMRESLPVAAAFRRVAVHLQKITDLGRSAADKLYQVGRQSENWLRALRAGSHDALMAAKERSTTFGSRISGATKQASVHVQGVQATIISRARFIADAPRRTREAHRTRENDLQDLLSSSPDAVAVIDRRRRLVAANPKALELFGISESHMRSFTIDAFLVHVEAFGEWNASSSVIREAAPDRCKIRRLDGGSRSAECEFVAEIIPRRHLFKFLNVTPYRITPPCFSKKNGSAATQKAENESKSDGRSTISAKRNLRRGIRPAV